MRILHLTSHLNVGGVTTYIGQLAEGLKRRGHEVMVASGGGALVSRLSQGGIRHWHLPLSTSAEFSPQAGWAWWRLSRRLTRESVDLLHAHTRVAQVLAHALWRARRIPYVTTWHGFYRRRLGRRWLPCTGERTIAIREPVSRHLQEVFRIPAQRIRLIPHGIDVASFSRPLDLATQEQARWSWGLPASGLTVGTVARLGPSEGVWQLLEAFREIQRRVPGVSLLIVGDGPQRPRLEQMAGALGFAQAVRFTGSLPDTRLALGVMDVFVFLPAVEEGFGLSLLEAMAAGKPIVSVRRGIGAAWVLDGQGIGLTVEPDRPDQLARAVVRMLQDPAEAQRLGQQAQALARERYDLGRVLDQVEAVYAECLNRTSDFRRGVV